MCAVEFSVTPKNNLSAVHFSWRLFLQSRFLMMKFIGKCHREERSTSDNGLNISYRLGQLRDLGLLESPTTSMLLCAI